MAHFDHFNILGPIYDLIFGRSKNKQIVKLSDVDQDQMVLDVGGGTGRIAVLFEGLTSKVYIADAAIKMIRQAQAKGIQTVNATSEELPFQAGSIDRIVMVDALHHVANQQKTLDEMWRLLAEGGKIVIEEPNIHNWFVKLIAIGEKLLLMRSHFLPPEKIVDMCQFDHESQVDLVFGKGIVWVVISRE
jgi:demethylmenaquinone methyltransferase/2-methoxy-6-polyprenyl-1,4-benzoquinol methylase